MTAQNTLSNHAYSGPLAAKPADLSKLTGNFTPRHREALSRPDTQPKSGKYEQIPRDGLMANGEPWPETYNRCKWYRVFRDRGNGLVHRRACGACLDCRSFRMDAITGQCAAQTVVSDMALGITLTYADQRACDVVDHYRRACSRSMWARAQLRRSDWHEYPQYLLDRWHSWASESRNDWIMFDDERLLRDALAAVRRGDGESMIAPSGARLLDKRHIELFMKRLRKAGYDVIKIAAGEYGGEKGRAHWHLIVWFRMSAEQLEVLRAAMIAGEEHPKIIDPQWRDRYPDFSDDLSGDAQSRAKDPAVLVVSPPRAVEGKQSRQRIKIRNDWRLWPFGFVQAEFCKTPELHDPEASEAAVRYITKYFAKDAWRDSRKWCRVPFDELPDHIKEQTRFGRWDHEKEGSKWVLGNPHVEALDAANERDFPGHRDDVPWDRQIRRGVYLTKAVRGIGADWFELHGAACAHKDSLPENQRRYFVGGNFRLKDGRPGGSHRVPFAKRSQREIGRQVSGNTIAIELRGVALPRTVRRRRFPRYMRDTAYRSYWRGMNAERQRMGLPPTLGPDDIAQTLEDRRVRANDASSGRFGDYISKRYVGKKRAFERAAASVPDDSLKGLFPARWRREMEFYSDVIAWREKGMRRLMNRVDDLEQALREGNVGQRSEAALIASLIATRRELRAAADRLNDMVCDHDGLSKREKKRAFELVIQGRNKVGELPHGPMPDGQQWPEGWDVPVDRYRQIG